LPIDHHTTAGDALYHRQQFEQGALAGTRVPGDEQQFAIGYRKRYRLERFMPAGIALGDRGELDHRSLVPA